MSALASPSRNKTAAPPPSPKLQAAIVPGKPQRRVHPRSRLSGPVTLVWRDDKERIRFLAARARNVSSSGVLVVSYRSLPAGTFVRIRSKKLFFLAGCARVQHCKRRHLIYHIGLKFYSDLSARY